MRTDYGTVFRTQGENEVRKATGACLQQEDLLSHLQHKWMVGMGGENACGFGFFPETSLGHQYHLMNH